MKYIKKELERTSIEYLNTYKQEGIIYKYIISTMNQKFASSMQLQE